MVRKTIQNFFYTRQFLVIHVRFEADSVVYIGKHGFGQKQHAESNVLQYASIA